MLRARRMCWLHCMHAVWLVWLVAAALLLLVLVLVLLRDEQVQWLQQLLLQRVKRWRLRSWRSAHNELLTAVAEAARRAVSCCCAAARRCCVMSQPASWM